MLRLPVEQRHTAGCLTRDERITYPFHPRRGEFVEVIAVKRHAGPNIW